MAYDTSTLELLHTPTEEGLEHYHDLLDKKAEQLVFDRFHPVQAIVRRLKERFFD